MLSCAIASQGEVSGVQFAGWILAGLIFYWGFLLASYYKNKK